RLKSCSPASTFSEAESDGARCWENVGAPTLKVDSEGYCRSTESGAKFLSTTREKVSVSGRVLTARKCVFRSKGLLGFRVFQGKADPSLRSGWPKGRNGKGAVLADLADSPRKGLDFRQLFLDVGLQVRLEAGHQGFFLAVVELFHHFFQGKVDHVVVVQLERRG